MLHLLKVERLINYIVIEHEEQLGSVLVLLEPLPDAGAFDAARQVCERLHNVKGPPTLRQVFTALGSFPTRDQMLSNMIAEQYCG